MNVNWGNDDDDHIEMAGTTYYLNWGMNGRENQRELLRSDGTIDGSTSLTHDLQEAGSNVNSLTAVGEQLFFTMDDGIAGDELWKTDGTVEGTVQVRDLDQSSEDSSPKYLTNVNGTLFLNAADNEGGSQLWKSDGTAEGTVQLTDFDSASDMWRKGPRNMVVLGRTLYFTSLNGEAGVQLWKLEPPPGDTNYDGVVDSVDMDRLNATIGKVGQGLAADFNVDGVVDAIDYDILQLNLGFGTGQILSVPGDANRDGQFDSADLVRVFGAGEFEDQSPHNSTWEDGDWDGDGDFTTSDIVYAFESGSYVADGARASTRVDIASVFDVDDDSGHQNLHETSSKAIDIAFQRDIRP